MTSCSKAKELAGAGAGPPPGSSVTDNWGESWVIRLPRPRPPLSVRPTAASIRRTMWGRTKMPVRKGRTSPCTPCGTPMPRSF